MIYSICCYYLKDKEDAKDLVQDIFRSIWERKNNLEIDTNSLKGYLIRAAKLRVLEYIRNKTISNKHLNIIKADVEAETVDMEEVFYSKLLSEKITRLIDRLPDQCRRVFKLSRGNGMTNAEIAKTMQISKRTVEYHISKALCILRQNLKEYPFA